MEFMITRTSLLLESSEKPTGKAYKEGEFWYIKINSLEELVELTKEEGEIIINGDFLEIYDSYRE